MTATLPTDVLLGHVSAYAAAVREHLSDLPPDVVDDLTDGLEADLVDALEDPVGPVATGEVALVRPGAGATAAMIDLRARFGPAETYAAELRAAAGLPPRAARVRSATVRERLAARRGRLAERVGRLTEPVRSSRHWPAVEEVLVALTPVWWVLRGWVWFVVLTWVASGMYEASFVPHGLGSGVVLAGLVLLSVQLARGRLVPGRRWVARSVRLAHVGAVLLVVPLLLAFWNEVENPPAYGSDVVYVEGPGQLVEPDHGVWVDGVRVSNLFVYDAEGNPLEGVQVFDDRGREVRTVDGDEWAEWYLPGLAEPWSFTWVEDADGRPRWNVYPLRGAPWDEWAEDDLGERFLDDDARRVPPRPFAKAPAVPSLGDASARDARSAAPDVAEGDAVTGPDAGTDAVPDGVSEPDDAPAPADEGADGADGAGPAPADDADPAATSGGA